MNTHLLSTLFTTVVDALSQVFKLLSPHFVFTLRMNANARSTLINQTGILEVSADQGQ